jgi:NADH:ubiquinone oxidoreductase subunit 5 (subunit L)/multisubunit Na+/H+ antiporter MnhA subunit
MAGLPFLLGFMAKDVFFQAVLGGPTVEEITLYLAVTLAASTLATIYALKVWAGTFLGSEAPVLDRGYPVKKISPWLLIVPGVLLVPQVIGGVVPGWFLGTVVEPGTTWGVGVLALPGRQGRAQHRHPGARWCGYLFWERLAPRCPTCQARSASPTGWPRARSASRRG